jgi:hypothetical protein
VDDGGDGWPVEDIYALLEADGWRWNGRHWVEVDGPVLNGVQVYQVAQFQPRR